MSPFLKSLNVPNTVEMTKMDHVQKYGKDPLTIAKIEELMQGRI